jgi:hypothetical protein
MSAGGTIGSIGVNVVADTGKFTPKIREAREENVRFAKSAENFEHHLKGMVAGLAAGFTIESLHQTAEEMERITLTAGRMGTSTEGFSRLSGAAKMSAVDIDSLSRDLTFMEKNLGKNSDAFRAIGLDVQKLKNMKADDAFLEIAEAISKLPTPADQTAAAVAIFGKAGAELVPILKKGKEGIQELEAEVDGLGATLGTHSAKEVEEMNHAIKKLELGFTGLKYEIVTNASPAVTFFVENTLAEFKLLHQGIEILDKTIEKLKELDNWKRAVGMASGAIPLSELAGGGAGPHIPNPVSGVGSALQSGSTFASEFVKGAIGFARTQPMGHMPFWNAMLHMPDVMFPGGGDKALDNWNALGGGIPADARDIMHRVDTDRPWWLADDAAKQSIGSPGVAGFSALEQGSVEAFRQERRSTLAGQDNIPRQSLEEAKKQTEHLQQHRPGTKERQATRNPQHRVTGTETMNWKKISYFAILILLLPSLAAAVDFTIKGGSFTYKRAASPTTRFRTRPRSRPTSSSTSTRPRPTSTWARPPRRRPRRARSSWPRRGHDPRLSTSCSPTRAPRRR